MRYFSLQDFQHWVLAVALGLILMIGVYIAWRGYPRDREQHLDDPLQDTQAGFVPESGHHPIAPLLVFIFAGTVVWAFGYMLVIGLFGGPIF